MRFPAVALIALVLASVPMAAQTPPAQRAGSVRIVVRDATGLPILGAEVTLMGRSHEQGSKDPDISAVKAATDNRGEARFEAVKPGTYSGRVTSLGFNPFDIAEFSIQPGGRVTRELTLQVAGVFEKVDVPPSTDDNRLMNSFVRELTADQIEALPEDPEELARVLTLLVGEDADIRVDGFKSGRLPLGTQIQEIRIRYDVGAASSGGGPRVEIRTTPGGNRWRNTASMTVRDASLNARNAFSGGRPTGQTQQYSWSLNGPLVRNRTGLSLTVDGSKSADDQTIRAAAPAGVYSMLIEQPSNAIGFWTRLDHAMTPAQNIRLELARRVSEARNQGIGDFDLPERAFTSNGNNVQLQGAHHATINRRYVNDVRFAAEWSSDLVSPLSDARTIRVLDAFTSGGAQQKGGRRSRTINVEHELEFTIRQRHQINTGLSVDGATYRGDESTNALGTYTFSSLADFEAGRPATFTQRVGDPAFEYSMYRVGWHVQDNYRLRRNLMVNVGLRYDVQAHLSDRLNFSPRLGVSWTPSSKARTTLRASAGMLRSALDAGIYEQLVLVDGRAQHDLVISSPGYPDPFAAGVTQAATPPSVIRARTDLVMPTGRRYTLGVDQPIGRFFRFRGTLSRQDGDNLFRSRNVNAPVNGIRPDPSVGNVTALENTARSRTQSVQTEVSINYPPRRLSAFVGYVLGKAMNETDAAFSLSPNSSDGTGEWGPSRGDVRHRVNAGVNSDLIGGFRLGANFRSQSASPYNITTGTDLNGDGIYSERPDGVTRNSGRGAGSQNLDLALTWRLSLGERQSPDGRRAGTPAPAARDADVFRFEIVARATNVLNLVNPQNFSGVLTSPFFGLPTSASAARRVVFGARVWF